mgnify:FL=1
MSRTAREAARRLQAAGSAVAVLAWSPGLVIPRSEGGFFRYSRVHNPAGQALFALVARDLLQLTESPQQAGVLLASLATTTPEHPEPFAYWSNRVLGPGRRRFERAEPSAEASSDAQAQELWELSARHASPAVADRGDSHGAPR